jgi:hypothetical protein
MLKKLCFLTAILISILFLSCTSWLGADNTNSDEKGNILIAVSLEGVGSANSRGLRATAHTILLLQLLDDLNNIIKDMSVSKSDALILQDMGEFPAGKGYKIIAWTEDDAGIVIHSPDTQAVIIEANNANKVIMTLKSRVGSIVMQFTDVKNTIESFSLAFQSDSGYFNHNVLRGSNTSIYLTLDNVPYGANGNLSLKILNKNGSYLAEWDTLFTFERKNVSLLFSFGNDDSNSEINILNGEMNIQINIENPYNTIISGIADSKIVLGEEINSGIVITEFSYNFGTGDQRSFVEIANLSEKTVTFNKLSVEVYNNGSNSTVAENVKLEPHETIVFINAAAASKDFWEPKVAKLVLGGKFSLSAAGSIILVKGDGILLDYVMYPNSSVGNTGWAKPATRASLYLTELNGDPKFNNIPGNWRVSTDAFIDGTTIYYGNPGKIR